jgi:propanol-preferring alcohol dehydrogenase
VVVVKAMLLDRIVSIADDPRPLRAVEVADPVPGRGEVLVAVSTCGVCHTELDEIEGRTPPPHLPVVPGHQVVGTVAAVADDVNGVAVGDRVGVAWIFSACGTCARCRAGLENLCADFRATGRDAHGGYAEFMTAPAGFVHPIPEVFDDVEAAPLLCAGAIGHRSLALTALRDGQRLGLTGFGASGHLVLKLARVLFPGSEIFVFARGSASRAFARELGADWVGGTEDSAPAPLHAIIDTTPAWTPVVAALAALEPGGRLVINAIRKESADAARLAGLDYAEHLWMEKEIKSVANVTRDDVRAFLDVAARGAIRSEVREYPLEQANRALVELRRGGDRGAKVLRVG